MDHSLKNLRQRYDCDGRDALQTKLKNLEEDLSEKKVDLKLGKEFLEKYSKDLNKVNQEINDLEEK